MAGNISTSSLLKSAASRQSKIRELEDSYVDYAYAQSAKTYNDYVEYTKHLQTRRDASDDPSKALSYTKKIDAARSGYMSNEIQRQSINIIEGRGSSTDKYNKMVQLYYQAIDAGDYDQAQQLNLSLDNLSVKIQNEMAAGQRAAGAMAMNGVKTLKALAKKITDGEDFIELPDGTVVKPLNMLKGEVAATGDVDGTYFQESLRTVQALKQTIADAYMAATSQEAVDAIEEKYGDILDGTKTFDTAAGKLSINEIELAYRSALANNPLYSPTAYRDEISGQTAYKLEKNKVDDFTWIRNDDGTFSAVETRVKVPSSQQMLDTKVTNEGYFLGDSGTSGVSNIGSVGKDGKQQQVRTGDQLTIKERLANQGIIAEAGDNGKLMLTLPDGTQYEGAINEDGTVNYFGRPGMYSGDAAGLYQIDIYNGGVREVAPDEISIFGTASKFGGLLSKPSDAGVNIIKSLAGVTQNDGKLFRTTDVINNYSNDFTGTGSPVVGSNLQGSTQILDAARQRQATLQAASSAANIQKANAFNLNQTPVQQYASNGMPIKQLKVATPTPVRKVTVAPPSAPQKITKVSVAQPTRKVSGVGVSSGSTRKVTVR